MMDERKVIQKMNVLHTKAHERIRSILDEGSFIEVGAYVSDRNANDGEKQNGDGVVTGYGTVEGSLVWIYAQNPEYIGGSVGEMHARKICNVYRRAMEMQCPVIGILDSDGIRLADSNSSMFGFGKLFRMQAEASGVIPQIAVVAGNCGGAMALAARMSDFVLMDRENGRLYLNSPDALAGNYREKCDTSSWEYQTASAGNCDISGSMQEITEKLKMLIRILPQNMAEDYSMEQCEDDMNRSTAGIDKLESASDILREISDNGEMLEIGEGFLKSMRTVFIRLNGRTVGAIANSTPQLCHRGSAKAARFVCFCDAFNIPVLTLCNVEKLRAEEEIERYLGGALSHFVYTFASATVPKITLVTKKSFGTAGLAMGSRAVGADLVLAWDRAVIGAMDPAKLSELTGNGTKDLTLDNASKGYIDDIISPAETRQRICAALEMLYSKCVPEVDRKHGAL